MNKELVVHHSLHEVDIALLEDKKLVELHQEKINNQFAIGDFYIGKVKKILPGLNAAFVDIGFEKDAFLHYTDLSPYVRSLLKFTNICNQHRDAINLDFSQFTLEPDILKTGKMLEVLGHKPDILVQILKEPIASKGPRLTCELSLPGRYLILTPFNNVIAVSKKISSSEEKKRLFTIIESIKPKNFGIIVRTASEGRTTAELHNDILSLLVVWKEIQAKLYQAKSPTKILSEQKKTTSILRDLLNEDFNKIVIDNKEAYNEVRSYIQKIAPHKESIVFLHQGAPPIFDKFNITKQIKSLFGKEVHLPSGSYLFIEHTEALHVIDVNSGFRAANVNQEDTALQTNLEAAAEIARQFRLRDIGGIIIIDFIDMRVPDNRRKLYMAMTEYMKTDRARHIILPLSKFGLMQITRQRMKPELHINTLENCPACGGTGKISSTINIEEEIEDKLTAIKQQGHEKIKIVVNPILQAYLSQGFLQLTSIYKKWQKKNKINITLISDNNIGITDYRFLNHEDEIIKL